MKKLSINKLNEYPTISEDEQKVIKGGVMTVEQLIKLAYILTPMGGSSYWVNQNDGTIFYGEICYDYSCDGRGYINYGTGAHGAAYPGLYNW